MGVRFTWKLEISSAEWKAAQAGTHWIAGTSSKGNVGGVYPHPPRWEINGRESTPPYKYLLWLNQPFEIPTIF
jgi:hypothetical protein